MLSNFFQIHQRNTTIRTEILAGITTFMTMAYILIINPLILSHTGMNQAALVTATALSAAIGTFAMALLANLPFALAPGMGLNAFFTYTVVLGMGHSWQFALTAILLEGLIFILLTIFNVREAIINAIPLNIKRAISVGIGLFIAFIGLVNAKIVITGMQHIGNNKLDGVIVKLGDLTSASAILAIIGLIITSLLLAKQIKGALLIGILLTTIIGIPFGLTHFPGISKLVSMPPSVAPLFFKFEWHNIFTSDMFIVLFTFLFVDMFDTVGTLIGVTTKANMLDKDGKVPQVKQALFADALGTTLGACIGTSTVTTFVESASGVAEGGRTGLTAFTVATLFLISLFFAPLFLTIPSAATAPTLILVGLFMISPVSEINFTDITEGLPAFLTIIMMPLTYSIAEGISFGIMSYFFLKLLTGKLKEIPILMYPITLLFIIKFLL